MNPVVLQADAASEIIDVFTDAFYDYPVMRYVLGKSDDYEHRLNVLNRLFVMGRVLRNEPLIGIMHEGALCAAATMSWPEKQADAPAGFNEVKEAVWEELGIEPRRRYEACVTAWDTLTLDIPQLHLNMIGVRRSMHGTKLGRKLLDEVQEISRKTPGSRGVSLTTELPRNVEVYQHIGYEITGYVRVTPDMETWALFRKD
jgi:GNAT superfamily N-acetyltransferase